MEIPVNSDLQGPLAAAKVAPSDSGVVVRTEDVAAGADPVPSQSAAPTNTTLNSKVMIIDDEQLLSLIHI